MTMSGSLMSDTVQLGGRIAIRRLESVEEYRECEKLQERIWGSNDIGGNHVVAMRTAQENGGHVLGAFTESDEFAGFVYSFIGLGPQRQPKHCSIMVAVDEQYRGQGIGYQLKLAQRRVSLSQGIELVTWSADPLQRVNAALNIRRLGGITREYRVNIYGRQDGLNFGMDTDRLVIEWWLRRHPRPTHWSEPCLATPVNHVMADERGLPRIVSTDLNVDSDDLFLAIPPNLARLKQTDLPLAQEWRALTRALFLTYFDRGYVVYDFVTTGEWPGYVLRRPAW